MSIFIKGTLTVPPNTEGFTSNSGPDGLEKENVYIEVPTINTVIEKDLEDYTTNLLDIDLYGYDIEMNLQIEPENVSWVLGEQEGAKNSNLFSFFQYGLGTRFTLTNGNYIECTRFDVKNRNISIGGQKSSIKTCRYSIDFFYENGDSVVDLSMNTKYLLEATMTPYNAGYDEMLSNNLSFIGQYIMIHPNYRDSINSIQDIADMMLQTPKSYRTKPYLSLNTKNITFNSIDNLINNEGEAIAYSIGITAYSSNSYSPLYPTYYYNTDCFTFSSLDVINKTEDDKTLHGSQYNERWYNFFNGADSTNDPSVVGPEDIPSGPGGGGGTWDDSSDVSGGIDLPTLQGMDVGLISAYQMDSNSLTQLASSLWSNDIASALKNIFSDPLSSVISLSILPIELTGTSIEITLGNVSTGVNGNKLSSRFYVVDCGNYTLKEYEGSYMDYNPHTKVSLYLPFIGIVGLNTNEVMGATINIQYAIDVLTGQCIAVVTVSKGNLQSVIYNYEGSCIVNMPITSNNMGQMGKMIIGGIGSSALGVITGNPLMTTTGMGSALAGAVGSVAGLGNIQRSGDVSGSAGMMNCKIPYLIIERQIKAYPSDFLEFEGRTSMITYQLSQLYGFTQISNIELEGITATEEELKEIESLLQGGVFL